jgi:hypothetical protein
MSDVFISCFLALLIILVADQKPIPVQNFQLLLPMHLRRDCQAQAVHSQHTLGQQRRELRVGQNATRRCYEARGVRRLCGVFSHSKSTGSPSNAMLAAT